MTEYFFSAVDPDGSHTRTSFEAESWLTVLDNFVLFLRGKGFYVSDDSIGVNAAHHCVDENECYRFTTFNNEEQE
jgi:hypothetical protein